jgi:hypothetical protein
LWNHLAVNRNSAHAYGKSVSWSWNILHGKMVGFFQQSPIHSQQVLEEQKEKGKKESGVGGSGFDWAILAFNAKWPNRTSQESHFFFCSFLSFLVTDCELGIGFPKELCVVGGCGTLDVRLVLATCGWWEKCRESLSSGQEAARSIQPWKFYSCQQPAKGVGYAAQV